MPKTELSRCETGSAYAAGMSRPLDPLVLGPPGVCDACGRYCCTLDQVGIPCYHCETGIFVHRMFWTFDNCAFCAGDTTCIACHGSGIMAAPREDLDLRDVSCGQSRPHQESRLCRQPQ